MTFPNIYIIVVETIDNRDMTDKKVRDKNRRTWIRLKDYELSYRHNGDAGTQTRFFQCENPEDALDAFAESFHGNADDIQVCSLNVTNPYTNAQEKVDVDELFNTHTFQGITLAGV